MEESNYVKRDQGINFIDKKQQEEEENILTKRIKSDISWVGDQRQVLVLDKKRYAVLLLFTIAMFLNAYSYFATHELRKTDAKKNHYGTFYFVFFHYINQLCMVVLYLPATYIIEVKGLNKAVLLGLTLSCIGCWCTKLSQYTLGLTLCGMGQPFILNATTKMAATWFGPKGRTIATTLALMTLYLSGILNEFVGSKIANGLLAWCIIVTFFVPVCYLLIYDKPDFSPTMSEEDKLYNQFHMIDDFKAMRKNRSFMLLAVASALFLININEMNQTISIFFYEYTDYSSKLKYIQELQLICVLSGILTFGMAIYSTLSLKFGYKIIAYQFVLIYILQIIGMLANSAVFLVIINVYDGLFKGGMFIVIYETSAELSYPIGESLSLGFINAIQCLARFILNVALGLMAEGLGTDGTFPIFIIYIVLFFVFTCIGIYCYYKSEFIMYRFQADCCIVSNQDDEDDDSLSSEDKESRLNTIAESEEDYTRTRDLSHKSRQYK